ncbi:MAG: tyrosine-type recombinase/integrase [Elusimicrobia bacterium]|nr:tyrosine-type recombinase/integrase [Elusimicrobiota bacterium]
MAAIPATLTPESLEWSTAERLFILRSKAQNLSQDTQANYGRTVAAFLAFLKASGGPKPAETRAAHIRGFLDSLQAKGNSSETVDTRWRHIKTLFRFLMRDGLLLVDPMASVERPRRERRLIKPFTVEQFKATLSQIDTKDPLGVRDRAVLLMLASTGLRISEALGLKIADLDLANDTAIVMGKGRRERRVVWCEIARRALIAWLQLRPTAKDSDPVFCNRWGKPLRRVPFAHRLKQLTRLAGVASDHLGPHAIRHMFACEFLRGGGDLITLQRTLGHRTLEMTRNYLNLADDEVLSRARSVGVLAHMGLLPGEKRRAVIR